MLALDVGNTFAKWRLELVGSQRMQGRCLTKDIVKETNTILNKYSVDDVFVSWVGDSSVKSEFVDSILSKGLVCHLLQSQKEMNGLSNGYVEYQCLGVDRWLAMLAVWTKYRRAFCVVDAGTALTIDMVNAEGLHMGGYILPGYRTTISALNRTTALIETGQEKTEEVNLSPASNTSDAVSRGALLSMVGGIAYALQHTNLHEDSSIPGNERICVLGGGDAGMLRPLLSEGWTLNEQVVLDGISVYAAALKQNN